MTMSQNSLEESQNTLLQSFGKISNILRAISHPNRFKVLILLLDGPKKFQTLLEKTELKKSALANHLTHLADNLLIDRIQHGMYSITKTGIDFIQAIESAYKQSEEFKLQYRLAKSFLDRKKETRAE
jgi:DNA-binding HxlR family transcriptional regulator